MSDTKEQDDHQIQIVDNPHNFKIEQDFDKTLFCKMDTDCTFYFPEIVSYEGDPFVEFILRGLPEFCERDLKEKRNSDGSHKHVRTFDLELECSPKEEYDEYNSHKV